MHGGCQAALLVAGGEAEVVGLSTAQTCNVTAVPLSLTQGLKPSADNGCQGKVRRAVRRVPGHDGGTVRGTVNVHLDLSGQTRS